MSTVFQFSSSASLVKLTGIKAWNLQELLEVIKNCSESSIFYHTFSAFMKMREVQAPYNSDFAVWVATSLNEKALAEKLTAVDFSEYNTIKSLKSRLVGIIEKHREEKPNAFEKSAEEPFYLHDVMRIVYLTDKFAYDLQSFRDLLQSVSIYSLYFHFIESRLERHLEANDFSAWFEESLGLAHLAQKVSRIDISVYTIEELRDRILQLIDKELTASGRKT